MFDAIKKDNARYALFALDMLTVEAREAASLETYNAAKYVTPAGASNDKTIAPKRRL